MELVSAFLSVIEHHGSAVVQLSCLWRTGIAPPVVDTVHLWVALAELGYLHVLVAGHGSMLAVMQGWISLWRAGRLGTQDGEVRWTPTTMTRTS